MPDSRSSTNSTRQENSPSPVIQRIGLQQANLDHTLAGGGAWSHASHLEDGNAQNNNGTAFPPPMTEFAGEIYNEELSDDTCIPADICLYSTNTNHRGAPQPPDHFQIAQGTELLNGTAYNTQFRKPSLSSEELGARQPTPSDNASLYQTDLGLSDQVHRWLATTPGHCNVHSVEQGNDRVVVQQSLTRKRIDASTGWSIRERDAASTRQESASTISYDNNRDTLGMVNRFELVPGALYNRSLGIDEVPGRRGHQFA